MRKLISVFLVVLVAVFVVFGTVSCKKQPTDDKAQSFNPQVDGVAVMPLEQLDIDKARQILDKVENTNTPATNNAASLDTPDTNVPSVAEPNMPPEKDATDPNYF